MSRLAKCIGCGCDDAHACPLGCAWLAVDRAAGLGVCSECPGELARFRARRRARGPIPGAAKLLRVLRETGPRKKTVCVGLVGGQAAFRRVLESLERRRLVKWIGERKGRRLAARGVS